MAQMQAAYPSAELLPDTADIWIALWIEMAEEHGIELFRKALWAACRTRVFFPSPAEIEAEVQKVKAAQRDALSLRRGNRHLRELAEMKALWEREREE